jgi:hypothetical protein
MTFWAKFLHAFNAAAKLFLVLVGVAAGGFLIWVILAYFLPVLLVDAVVFVITLFVVLMVLQWPK